MRLHPTLSLIRALVAGAVAVLLGVLFGRIDIAIVGVPLLVYGAWAAWTRPEGELPKIALSPAHAQMKEGDAVSITIDAPPGLIATATLPPVAQARLDPPYGAVIGGTTQAAVSLGFEPLRWGRYTVGPATVALTDPAGAWRAFDRTSSSAFSVRPQATTLEGFSGVARPIGIAGVHGSTRRGDGTAIADIREFVPGDRLRRINWKVTSRTRRLHVTETYVDRDTDVLIAADTMIDVPAPDPAAATSLDSTVRAIAAISQHYVSLGDRVGVHDFGASIGPVRRGTGARQAKIILDVLARANRTQDGFLVPRRVRHLSAGTLVFVCTPLLDTDVLGEISRLRVMGGEVIVVDTLPDGIGRADQLGSDEEWMAEGWMLRRLEREQTVHRLQSMGIPVTPWRGPASLGSVLMAMAAARDAPRLRGGA